MKPAPNNANILGALGTLVGYVGTEISVGDLFERFLWLRRFYNGLSAKSIWKLGFLMPMGGPLHNACRRTLDSFYHMGLFKGGKLGHMLGTAFFSDTGRPYQVHEPNASPRREHVRNGLWVRAIDEMPMLLADPVSGKPQQEDAVPLARRVRQQITVSHLRLYLPDSEPTRRKISHDTEFVTART